VHPLVKAPKQIAVHCKFPIFKPSVITIIATITTITAITATNATTSATASHRPRGDRRRLRPPRCRSSRRLLLVGAAQVTQ
jgi:hypothetical protein